MLNDTVNFVAVAESAPMSAIDAADLTKQIRAAVDDTWLLVHRAHQQRAWASLRFASWSDYVAAELGISRRHANRLVAQGEVIHAIRGAVGPTGPTDLTVTEREARDVRPQLDRVVADIAARVADGAPARVAVTEVVAAVRASLTSSSIEPEDDVPTERDIAEMIVRIVDSRLEAASDSTRDEWLVAVQLADVVRDWAGSTLPNFYFFTQVATVLYTRQTPLVVWAVFAPWLVVTASKSLEEYAELRVGRRADGRVPGEDLARVTIALWGPPVDDDMRLLMFKGLEPTLITALKRTRGSASATGVVSMAEVTS